MAIEINIASPERESKKHLDIMEGLPTRRFLAEKECLAATIARDLMLDEPTTPVLAVNQVEEYIEEMRFKMRVADTMFPIMIERSHSLGPTIEFETVDAIQYMRTLLETARFTDEWQLDTLEKITEMEVEDYGG